MSKASSKELFIKRLSALIEKHSLKHIELAKQLDISSSAISAWLYNKTFPSKKNIKKLSAYFRVTEDYLIGNTDQPTDRLIIDPKTGEQKSQKIIGIPVLEHGEKIIKIIRTLEPKHGEFLYNMLLIMKDFNTVEWQLSYILIHSILQHHHSSIKLYNPLANFYIFKSLFYNIFYELEKLLELSQKNALLYPSEENKKIKFQMDNFEQSLENDYKDMPKIFNSKENLEHFLPHTKKTFDEIIKYLNEAHYASNHDFDKEQSECYTKPLIEAYEQDIQYILSLFNGSQTNYAPI